MDEQTALNMLREDYLYSEYEAVEEWVDDGHQKHDITSYYSIFLRKRDNTFWKVCFLYSYSHGLDEYGVRAFEVEKKEVKTVEWVSK